MSGGNTIGLALLLGILVRFAAIMGIMENGLFWAAAYMAKYRTATGALAVNHGPFYIGWSSGPLDLNTALVAMYILCILIGAGLIYGLDAYIQKTSVVQKHKWLKFLLC